MRWPRLAHWLYAIWNQYFWIPCGKCGGMFGGHEKGRGRIVDSVKYHQPSGQRLIRGQSTCPRCPGTYLRREGRLFEVSEQVLNDLTLGITTVDREVTLASIREALTKPGSIG